MSSYGDIVYARTSRDVAAVVRQRRKTLGWTQADLAAAAGVTRAWVISLEQGKSKVELTLVLRTLAVLGLVADVVVADDGHGDVDLDKLLA